MSDLFFIKDPGMDAMISDIVDIFVNVEGVNLVRLSGMTNRARKISGRIDMPKETVNSVINKLKNSGIIKYSCTTICPHCGETSYIIKSEDGFLLKPKICDTCSTFYTLVDGISLYK